MRQIILVLLIMGGCCSLPLVDCVKDYYYVAQEGKCENNQDFCYSSEAVNVKIFADFLDAKMISDGQGVYKAKIVIDLENQTDSNIIIDNKTFEIYCLLDNDILQASLDTLEYNIGATSEEIITVTPSFVFDNKHYGFLKKHKLSVELGLSDSIKIQSIFELKRKNMN